MWPKFSHTRGFFWDTISVESSGGLDPLVVSGLPKGPARYFVEHVRERLNERPVAAALGRHCERPAIVLCELRIASSLCSSHDSADYAAAFTSAPLNTKPSRPAEILTFSPSLMRPERMSSASGSCTDFWIVRLSGRAP